MKIIARDFGEIEINPEEIVEFKAAIFGFEELKKFVLLSDDNIPGPFTWLQSVEDADICFILVDPFAVMPGYAPQLSEEVKKQLALDGDAVFRAIAVIPQDFAEATINLKSPIVINPQARCAAQVILDQEYPIRAPLLSGDREEAAC